MHVSNAGRTDRGLAWQWIRGLDGARPIRRQEIAGRERRAGSQLQWAGGSPV